MTEQVNLQDAILKEVRRDKVPVTLFLMNGFQLRGIITGFDSFVVVLVTDGRQQMIYKHAISTLAPIRPLKAAAAMESLPRSGGFSAAFLVARRQCRQTMTRRAPYRYGSFLIRPVTADGENRGIDIGIPVERHTSSVGVAKLATRAAQPPWLP